MKLGDKIKKYREENRMTQRDIAEILEVEPGTVSKYESGMLEPNIESIKRLSETFGITIDELLKENDDKVDALNKRIEEKCLIYMATQSPMASDLRKMFAASKIVTDLERIADYAVDICKINKRIEIDPLGEAEIPLWNMVEILSKMINMSVEAFVNSDVEEAYRICKLDDEVDVIYRKLFNDVIKKMSKDENLINKGTQILFASKYLERMGDHITNICEWIIFSKEGDYVDLNE